jgi:hypothetical protein
MPLTPQELERRQAYYNGYLNAIHDIMLQFKNGDSYDKALDTCLYQHHDKILKKWKDDPAQIGDPPSLDP